ncbi:MAG: hypothetical protein ABJA02_10065, partial [Acidobacteriota bacterium]
MNSLFWYSSLLAKRQMPLAAGKIAFPPELALSNLVKMIVMDAIGEMPTRSRMETVATTARVAMIEVMDGLRDLGKLASAVELRPSNWSPTSIP